MAVLSKVKKKNRIEIIFGGEKSSVVLFESHTFWLHHIFEYMRNHPTKRQPLDIQHGDKDLTGYIHPHSIEIINFTSSILS